MEFQIDLSRFTETRQSLIKCLNQISRYLVEPGAVLKRLALSSDDAERISAADHCGAALEVLLFLCDDENADVRYALAENHNISQTVLRKLSNDSNPYVSHRAERTLARVQTSSLLNSCALSIARLAVSREPEVARIASPYANTEMKCRKLLSIHRDCGSPDDIAIFSLLQDLAQALEGQSKYLEGHQTRLECRDLLISLMSAQTV